MNHRVSKAFARDEVRENVIPVYMGLIKQIDDQLGELFAFLDKQGIADSTMIVMTSDHGDYLGDHWMGEKDLFHDASAKIPLIVYDPSREADTTRGTTCDELVESIDLVPTFVDWLGGKAETMAHRLEGRSLLGFLHGKRPAQWREAVFSEYDYTMTPTATALGVAPKNARLFMVADKQWKYMHAIGFRPMLFDLVNDPGELVDLGTSPEHEEVRARMAAILNAWGLRFAQRTTRSDGQLQAMRGKSQRKGILIGVWDESDIPTELWAGYPGSLPPEKGS
jgi:arylsulfatase A-like enzyme